MPKSLSTSKRRRLLPLILPLVLFSALAAIWAGWIRIGWYFPMSELAGRHGALMVGSFLGTLISLERAVVAKHKAAMLVPLLSGLSVIFFMLGLDVMAFSLLAMGSFGQSAIMYYFLVRYKDLFLGVMFAGSVCWLVGNLMWLAWESYPLAVPWWMAFLLLIITGERLELTRFLPVKKSRQKMLMLFLGLFLLGIIVPFHVNGRYLAGTGLIFSGLWLLRYDMATKAVGRSGQHRFSAVVLLTGYIWLMLSGTIMLMGDLYGYIYDAVLHSFFIGFVFSMIFAHGPVILPGVLGKAIRPYHGFLYIPAIILDVALVMRVTGDIFGFDNLRKWGGMWNGIAILLFFIAMAFLINVRKKT